mmetsp:Transcript_57417/g.136890  ORF Transcript_57417/g.136890 Transcript_57417/m.136890 type:complete len:205 (+) Transcript_57417:1985-2599(+)
MQLASRSARWVAQPSIPSKMCVQYTTVVPFTTESWRRKRRRLRRAMMSRSVVASSRRQRSCGGISFSTSWILRRWPSDTEPTVQWSSTPRSERRRRPRRSVSSRWSSAAFEIADAKRSLTDVEKRVATRLDQSPATSATRRCTRGARNASCPSTDTTPSGAICCPASTESSVDFPAPFAPTSTSRLPDSIASERLRSTSGLPSE